MDQPTRLTLDAPGPFLRWLSTHGHRFSFDDVEVAEVWSLVGIGALARREQPDPIAFDELARSAAGRFAYALGLDDLVRGTTPINPGQHGRTVKLARLSRPEEIEPGAEQISRLLFPSTGQQETRLTVKYVLVELLRNVVQHSKDPLGGVVAAQYNDGGRHASRPTVQVAVADAGIGIPASLRPKHPNLVEPEVALERAMWPHISGAFEEGESGTLENAGMGLFFIAEMTKRLAGTLLIASRGAALELVGDPEFGESHRVSFEMPSGTGFAGTLVAFEIAANAVDDPDGLFEVIRKKASERAPRRAVHRWLRFEEPPAGSQAQRFVVQFAVEDTGKALEFAAKTLLPRLIGKKQVVLDFRNIPILTQSFLHALLYEPLRVAWALKTEIWVVNAKPAVRSNLELLQNYALGG